jgi:protein-tyrosine phosphatase/arsenate reductase
MNDAVFDYLAKRRGELDRLSAKRKALLDGLTRYVRRRRAVSEPTRLVFICTHNSRRSHLAQLWAAAAADLHGVDIAVYSGGTEETAFNPRAVSAMERAGFRIERVTEGGNPTYHAWFSDDRPPIACFSKKYDHAANPDRGFAAVMVCGEADAACPIVAGADARFAIPYDDPKAADGTLEESAVYDERCAQIAREMLYVMSRVEEGVSPGSPCFQTTPLSLSKCGGADDRTLC